MGTTRRGVILGALGAAATAGIAACAPGGSGSGGSTKTSGPISTDPAKAGKVTLTEWDQNTPDSGVNEVTEALNAAFMKKYPNVTIKRVSRSFGDLKTTLKLALSGNNPPDVVQANQGYPDMGAFVKAALLLPLNRYADTYGWTKSYPSELLDLNKFSGNGKTWQAGNLYGISQTGEIVGVFYNKKLLSSLGIQAPTSYPDFVSALAKAKSAGHLPIAFGNSDKSPAIHLYGVVQAAIAGKQEVRDLVQNQNDKSWTDSDNVKAAQAIQDWAKKGYLSSGFNGQTMDTAQAAFAAGKAVFCLQGTWAVADLAQKMGAANVGFTALSPTAGATPLTQGGEGLAWAVTSKSKHPDVAAAYLNFLNDESGMSEVARTGNLPAIPPPSYQPTAGTVNADVLDSWNKVSKQDGLLPYLDYTTPTFYDTLTAALQELLAGQQSAQAFGKALQADYDSFRKSQ
jgi:raffinose/stachyose/melibiose transport system substrate-binding protein